MISLNCKAELHRLSSGLTMKLSSVPTLTLNHGLNFGLHLLVDERQVLLIQLKADGCFRRRSRFSGAAQLAHNRGDRQ